MSTDLDIDIKRSVVATRPAVVKIHYGQIGMMQLRIGTTDTGALLDELTGRIATAPKFFQRTAVCLDLSELDKVPEPGEILAVLDAVRRAGMVSVGLAGGSTDIEALSTAVNLPILSAFRAANNPFAVAPSVVPHTAQAAQAVTGTQQAAASGAAAHRAVATPKAPATMAAATAATAPAEAATSTLAPSGPATATLTPPAAATAILTSSGPTMATLAPLPPATAAPAPAAPESPAPVEVGLAALMHHQTVRSGQRLYARDRDLVITAGVGAGAEIMADGCVHIYGSLRGRAMAGVHGQLTARVFCQEFHAELVSIAGVFRVFETIPAELAGKPVQAWLDGEDLHFAAVGN